METCRVEECSNPVLVKSRQLCKTHYHRLMSTGETGEAGRRHLDGGAERWRQLYRVDADGCWIWTGSLDKYGYGQFDVRSNGARKNWRAHRWVYTQMARPLEPVETLDHLCRVHACVNPEHLEPVPHRVNVERGEAGKYNAVKTHCKRGHEFTEANTIRVSGGRQCRECARANTRGYMRANRGTAADAVVNAEKTRCAQGHEFTEANTRYPKRGGRACIACARAKSREYMRQKRAAQPTVI